MVGANKKLMQRNRSMTALRYAMHSTLFNNNILKLIINNIVSIMRSVITLTHSLFTHACVLINYHNYTYVC